MDRFAGTRAEREWLAALRGIRDALDEIATELRRLNDRQESPEERAGASGPVTPSEHGRDR